MMAGTKNPKVCMNGVCGECGCVNDLCVYVDAKGILRKDCSNNFQISILPLSSVVIKFSVLI